MKKRSTATARHALAVASTLVLIASLAACTQSSNAVGSGEQVTLKVYGWADPNDGTSNVNAIDSAFEDKYPNIKVDYEYIPANEVYTQRVQPELLAGTAADVIMTEPSRTADWAASGYLEPLNDESWTSSVSDQVRPFVTSGNDVVAAPIEVIGIGLFANMDLLKQAGITEVPTDYPSFVAACDALTAAGIKPLALPDKGGWTSGVLWQAMASTLVYQDEPGWDNDLLNGKTTFADTEGWKQGLEQLQDLNSRGLVDWKSELGVDEFAQGLPDFQSGKSAFWFQGAWNVSLLADVGFKTQFAPWPAGDAGSDPSSLLYVGRALAVNAASSQKDAAKKYVEFWTQAENLNLFLEGQNALNPYTGGASPENPVTAPFRAAYEAGRYSVLPSNTWGSIQTTVFADIQGLLLGQKTESEVLTGFDAAVADLKK